MTPFTIITFFFVLIVSLANIAQGREITRRQELELLGDESLQLITTRAAEDDKVLHIVTRRLPGLGLFRILKRQLKRFKSGLRLIKKWKRMLRKFSPKLNIFKILRKFKKNKGLKPKKQNLIKKWKMTLEKLTKKLKPNKISGSKLKKDKGLKPKKQNLIAKWKGKFENLTQKLKNLIKTLGSKFKKNKGSKQKKQNSDSTKKPSNWKKSIKTQILGALNPEILPKKLSPNYLLRKIIFTIQNNNVGLQKYIASINVKLQKIAMKL